MLIYCIRHGETIFNASGRIQGQMDSQLSPMGMQQCKAVGVALAKQPIEAIYASPLRRAAESAAPLAAELNLEIRFDDRLMEINAGLFQGMCWPEIEAAYPEDAKLWRTHDPDFRLPKGESRRDLMLRSFAVFQDIRNSGHLAVAVVAHGGSLAAAFKMLLEIPAARNPFNLQNGSISRLQWAEMGDVKLLSLNQVDHLHGLLGSGGDL